MPDLDDLRRASTEQLLHRHIGEPLQRISVEMLEVAAERIAAVLADLELIDRRIYATSPGDHKELCWRWHAGCLAARIRATLTGEDHPQ